jgi:hypothetical protein
MFFGLLVLLSGCVRPGYHYETGDFFTQTPNTPAGPAWTGLSPKPVATAKPSICDGATPQQCTDRLALEDACQKYSIMAFTVFSYRSTRLTEEMVNENMAQMAYGPNGMAKLSADLKIPRNYCTGW